MTLISASLSAEDEYIETMTTTGTRTEIEWDNRERSTGRGNRDRMRPVERNRGDIPESAWRDYANCQDKITDRKLACDHQALLNYQKEFDDCASRATIPNVDLKIISYERDYVADCRDSAEVEREVAESECELAKRSDNYSFRDILSRFEFRNR